ncbi:MAG: hypothetical protein ACR2RV_02740 [Verrucomicrobiales bacterium]
MKFFPLHLSIVALSLPVLMLPLSAQDEAGKDKKRVKRTVPAEGGEAEGETVRNGAVRERREGEEVGKGLEIGKLLPLNKPNLQVKIPGFEKGELASMVEAEKLTRIDDVNLRLEDATIELVQQELLIRLRNALYNTKGAILSSNETTTVSSKQFTMTGDTMDFDTKTGKGRMTAREDGTGIVRMIIHNVDAMDGKKGPDGAADRSEGAATAADETTKTEDDTEK